VIDVKNYAEERGAKGANQEGQIVWSIEPLEEAISQFQQDALVFEEWGNRWEKMVYGGGGFESDSLGTERRTYNNRMAEFETNLLDLEEDDGVSRFF
jgi:hypothetical protein